ncbi:MAG: Fur family transcriptional regulator [Dehalococcoidia bacterium]|nr:Fur family transcriptional regulator [Dehalococcoidia bacterium]
MWAPAFTAEGVLNQVMTTPPTASRPDMMAVLEDRGYRSTAPRRAIIRILEGKEEGFTAEEIGSELPGVGRATIFRTIKLLMEVGVICRLNLIDGAPKYSLSRIEHHHHTVCVRCGIVGEFRATTVERLMRSLGSEIPGEIMGHRIELYVTCDRCVEGEGN